MALEDTPHLGLPLPHPDNSPRTVDVPRLRAALTAIDGHLKDLQDAASALEDDKADKARVAIDIATAVSQAISDLLNGAPEAYDTLKEIADKLADTDDVVSGIIATIATKAAASSVYTKAEIDHELSGKANSSALGGKANLSGGNAFTGPQRVAFTSHSVGAAILTLDLEANNGFAITMTGNPTIANPSNIASAIGQEVLIVFRGAYQPSFGSFWKFPKGEAPSFEGGLNAIGGTVLSSTEILVHGAAGYA
ncbi:hypothetical protein [Aquamicrobium zhengzhouense]|uniref:Tail fiber protein n=1 Tax=Aquamicrobium zhengzhouense TaxID=2781738 RepID=A0ABS0SA56_9HYPH|nr:hypothetical protein [Aquamicrobium zhengzhouense]MBI1620163.1 hypothetical protein [Aquamicrobium zhengzhouense]